MPFPSHFLLNRMLTLIDTIDAADLPGVPLRAALAHWHGARVAAAMPAADRLDMASIDRALLPHLALLAAPDGQGRLFGLFMGSAAMIAVGRDITGRFLDDVYPAALYGGARRFFEAVIEGGGPVYEEFVIGPDSGHIVRAGRLGLPYAGADGAVSRILLALQYQPSPMARVAGVRVMQERTRLHQQNARRVRL